MNKTALFLAVALFLVLAASVQEIKMEHRKRTPREAKVFLDYMSRGAMTQKVHKLLSKIFPSELTPNIYAYPEVKIINYLDAQYYG